MKPAVLAALNVLAMRRRLAGLLTLIVLAVGVCLAAFAITDRAAGVSEQRVEEGATNRSVLLHTSTDRNDIRALTTASLDAVAALPGVVSVEPVLQASFGYKGNGIAGVLLYATTPRTSVLPPVLRGIRRTVFPLRPGEMVLPARGDGVDLGRLLGKRIRVEVTRQTGAGTGTSESREVRVVGLFEPSWQIDGPNAAYVDSATVLDWAALRAGTTASRYAETAGYDSASVVARFSAAVPALLRKLQQDGYSATSLRQELEALPTVLELIRVVGVTLLVVLVLVTGFSAFQVMAALARQRRREIGILKAVGFSDGAVFRMLAVEAFLVAVLGAAAGLAVAVVLGTAGNAVLRLGTHVRTYLGAGFVGPDLEEAVAAVAAVVLVVGAGSVVPVARAAAMPPAEAMKEW